MGKISQYSTDSSPVGSDYLLGNKASGPSTQSFKISDIQNLILSYFDKCKLSSCTNTNVASGSVVDATWGTKDIDTNNMANLGTNASIINIIKTGIYLVYGRINWAIHSDVGPRQIYLQKNGTVDEVLTEVYPNASINNYLQFSTIVSLTAGDYLKVRIEQSSGTTLSIGNNSDESNEFFVVQIG